MGKCSVVGCGGYAPYIIDMLSYCSDHLSVGRAEEQKGKILGQMDKFIKEQEGKTEILNKDLRDTMISLFNQMNEKIDKLNKKLDNMDKRLSRIEFSPYPLGGTQFCEILKEEKEDGILNKND